jgi:hypothetical protein
MVEAAQEKMEVHQGKIGAKMLANLNFDTRVPVTIVRPDITRGLPERDLSTPFVLQMASREILPIMKGVLVKLTLGQLPLTTWVLVTNITDEFTQGLYIMQAHNASMDLRQHVLRLGDGEVQLQCPWA